MRMHFPGKSGVCGATKVGRISLIGPVGPMLFLSNSGDAHV